MCDWKHWLVLGEKAAFSPRDLEENAAFSTEDLEENAAFSPRDLEENAAFSTGDFEWDYYDEEYCLRKLGIVNRERDDIGF